jgi:hypothetical protein
MNSNSPKFSLNLSDWQKVLVGVEVALAGVVITYLPTLMNFSYVFTISGHQLDLTAIAYVLFSTLSNIIRKFVTDHSQ